MYDRRGFGEALLETNIQYIWTKYRVTYGIIQFQWSKIYCIYIYIIGVYIFYILYRSFVINIVDSVYILLHKLNILFICVEGNFFFVENWKKLYRRGENIIYSAVATAFFSDWWNYSCYIYDSFIPVGV